MLEVAVAYDTEALNKMAEEIQPRVAEALRQNAETILEMAKMNCPVRTGALRDSLHIEQTGEFEYAVRDGVPYGIFVEKGHRSRAGQFVEPRPFLGPAVDFTWPICEQRVKDAITIVAEKAPSEADAQKRSDERLSGLMGGRWTPGGRSGILARARAETKVFKSARESMPAASYGGEEGGGE